MHDIRRIVQLLLPVQCTFCVHMALLLVPPNRSIDLCAYRLGGVAK